MGAWSESITWNDAEDLLYEYPAAFLKYEPEEAVSKIDQYVRENEFDESEPEEWCNYVYSLADYMWKKGILTDKVKERAIQMIDSGFGLDIWAESGDKMLKARKRVLSKFREKLTSPMPPKKKIKLDINQNRIFENGDVIAIQLQTAGKNYTQNDIKQMSEEEFHAFDGKYILMQLIDCRTSWSSAIVPEIKDYWAYFRLFDGIYDTVPEVINYGELKPAKILDNRIVSCFTCESKMIYFKRRNCKLIGNTPILDPDEKTDALIFFGINRNPDPILVAAMGNEIFCGEYNGTDEQLREICKRANRYGRNLRLLYLSEKSPHLPRRLHIFSDKCAESRTQARRAPLPAGRRRYGRIPVKARWILQMQPHRLYLQRLPSFRQSEGLPQNKAACRELHHREPLVRSHERSL